MNNHYFDAWGDSEGQSQMHGDAECFKQMDTLMKRSVYVALKWKADRQTDRRAR